MASALSKQNIDDECRQNSTKFLSIFKFLMYKIEQKNKIEDICGLITNVNYNK